MATKKNNKTCKNGTWCLNETGATQPVENFHRYSRSKDGRKSECRSCRLDYQRSYDSSNTEARSAKRKVYANFYFGDERQVAFNYLAKQLGIKAKVAVEGDYMTEIYRSSIRKTINTNFTTKSQKAAAFNLISYQLGHSARA